MNMLRFIKELKDKLLGKFRQKVANFFHVIVFKRSQIGD